MLTNQLVQRANLSGVNLKRGLVILRLERRIDIIHGHVRLTVTQPCDIF